VLAALLSDYTLWALVGFAFLAGFVDAIVGGGGLIQVPALLVLRPDAGIPTLFGTNKFASIFGTASAALRYLRTVSLPWGVIATTAAAAFAASFLGAKLVSQLDPNLLKPVVLLALLMVLAYTLWKKDLGKLHAPKLARPQQYSVGMGIGAVLGFYDGFLGPGTGSFLIFAFVGLFGFSFLAASAAAKCVNFATNAAALSYFIPHQQVLYQLAIPMAASNVAGSYLGSHLALKKGSGFVRLVFLGVVSALLCKLAWDIAKAQ